VVARLQRDDGGGGVGRAVELSESVDLGVRRPGAAVMSRGELGTVGGQQHAADAGVGRDPVPWRPGGVERAAHRRGLGLDECHRRSLRPWADSGDQRQRQVRGRQGTHTTHRFRRVLPLIRTLTVGPGVPPGQPRLRAGAGRGLSPPVRTFTDPGARERELAVEYATGCGPGGSRRDRNHGGSAVRAGDGELAQVLDHGVLAARRRTQQSRRRRRRRPRRHRSMVSAETPPSTCSQMSPPARSRSARVRSIFGRHTSRNDWPPKPARPSSPAPCRARSAGPRTARSGWPA
jgi:hypothetical protein